jgi:hypothetical protein
MNKNEEAIHLNRLPCPWGVSPVPAWGQVTDFTSSRTPPLEESCSDFHVNRRIRLKSLLSSRADSMETQIEIGENELRS